MIIVELCCKSSEYWLSSKEKEEKVGGIAEKLHRNSATLLFIGCGSFGAKVVKKEYFL